MLHSLLLYIIFLKYVFVFYFCKEFWYFWCMKRDFSNESPIDKVGVWIEIVWHEIRPKILTSFLFLIPFPQQLYLSDIWEHLTIHIKRNSPVSQKRSGWWHDHHCLHIWESGKTQMAYVHLAVNSGNWWWTGRPGVLRFTGLQSRTRLSDWTDWWCCMH